MDPWAKGGSGAAGALLWMVTVYGIQLSLDASKGQLQWKPSKERVLGVIGLVSCYLLLGAAAPFIVDAHTAKEAVAEGLGWQGIFGQFAKPKMGLG
jgi:hypothetical protein